MPDIRVIFDVISRNGSERGSIDIKSPFSMSDLDIAIRDQIQQRKNLSHEIVQGYEIQLVQVKAKKETDPTI